MTSNKKIPLDGIAGLKENWKSDFLSGFLVSLIALPLCLGIASASGFPPVMGVLTAIVGGIIVSFFAGSQLTIKGPAAGLIVIVAGAVEELGKGDPSLGWKLALGVVVIAGLIQIVFGLLKVAVLADFFPLSAVHGMLAAIGIIIMSKQLHFALGAAPALLKGKEPLELIELLPHTFMNISWPIATVGLVSLVILFGMPMIKNSIVKKIPPALVVLIVAILLGQYFNLSADTFKDLKPLVNPGEFKLNLNADFGAIMNPELLPIFLKYLLMFTLIGTLESLLTGKAIDLLDPYQRKANLSKDLTAVGIGNTISGLLGGLPMISEVARSSANINNGGKTRWANLFHGLFLLLFVVVLVPVIKLVPVAALAAMLIFVGFRLAHPKEFLHAYHIGKEQLAIFVLTIVVTLATDLLLGIGAGILLKIVFHLFNGVPFKDFFKAVMVVEEKDSNRIDVYLNSAGIFSNYLQISKTLKKLPQGKNIVLNMSSASYVDHTFLENIHLFEKDYNKSGGHFTVTGLNEHRPLSNHPMASRKKNVKA